MNIFIKRLCTYTNNVQITSCIVLLTVNVSLNPHVLTSREIKSSTAMCEDTFRSARRKGNENSTGYNWMRVHSNFICRTRDIILTNA